MDTQCEDCKTRTPAIPVYTKANYIKNPGCVSCGAGSGVLPILPPSSSGGKSTEIIPGSTDIHVDDRSDGSVDRFIISYRPQIALTVDLLLDLPLNTLVNGILLRGESVNEANLSWVYNKAVAGQSLTNTDSLNLVEPSLLPSEITHSYSGPGIDIKKDTVFTIRGDDNKGLPTSVASQSKSILFGNYVAIGINTVKGEHLNPTELKSLIDGFLATGTTNILSKTQARSIVGIGDFTEYYFYAFPKDFGFAIFSQNNFDGGFIRLADVGGSIVSAEMASVETGENDILINNGLIEEPYVIYQAVNAGIEGQKINVRKA